MSETPGKPRKWWVQGSSRALSGDPTSVPRLEGEPDEQPSVPPAASQGDDSTSTPSEDGASSSSENGNESATFGQADVFDHGPVEHTPHSETHSQNGELATEEVPKATEPVAELGDGVGGKFATRPAPLESHAATENVGEARASAPGRDEIPSQANVLKVSEPCPAPAPEGPRATEERKLIDLFRTLEPLTSAPVDTVGFVVVTRCRNAVRRGHVVNLKQPKVVIGSGYRASIPVDGPGTAESHAVISFENRAGTWCFFVHPIGEVNLNGAIVAEPTRLSNGDRITIGETELAFVQVDLHRPHTERTHTQ